MIHCRIVQQSSMVAGIPRPRCNTSVHPGGTMWVLLAIAVVVVGFALRLNSMLVVTAAGIVAGLIGGLSPVKILNAFGDGFAGSRSVTVFIVTLPVIGLIERYGLQQQARKLIGKLKVLTTGRLLAIYLLIRQA